MGGHAKGQTAEMPGVGGSLPVPLHGFGPKTPDRHRAGQIDSGGGAVLVDPGRCKDHADHRGRITSPLAR